MNKIKKVFKKNLRVLISGFSDGILTALTIAAHRIIESNSIINLDLALRVSIAGASSSAFIFAVAQYAQLRSELVEAEKQLNLTSHGKLVSSNLGRAVFFESIISALLGSSAGFLGALFPLYLGIVVPDIRWFSIASALIVLAILGLLLAITVHGRKILWALCLTAAGVVFTYLGMQLKLL